MCEWQLTHIMYFIFDYPIQVIWKRLYKTASSKEIGTLHQLRNVINRRNVTTKPKKDFNAHDDFFTLVVTGYVLGAATEILGMEKLEDDPCQQILPPDVWLHDKCERRDILMSVAGVIVNEYVDLTMLNNEEKLPNDRIHGYARELLTLGLFYLEYSDAIREGDGLRVLRCWRYLFLLFKASNRTNYTIEAFKLSCTACFLATNSNSRSASLVSLYKYTWSPWQEYTLRSTYGTFKSCSENCHPASGS